MFSNYFKPHLITYSFSVLLLASALMLQSFTPKPVKEKPKKELTVPFQLYSAFINFQDSAVTPPSGFDKDYGKGFGTSSISAIGSTFSYGWKNAATDAPIDISEEAAGNGNGAGKNRLGSSYNSASTTEKLEGTFIHIQGNNISGWENQPRGKEVYWELEVPNGYIEVTLSFGDKDIYTDSRHTATVEGYSIIAAFAPQSKEIRKATMLVKVDDGLLTINGLGGFNSKINYIEVNEIVDDEDAADGILTFTPQSKNLNLIVGEENGVIASSLSGEGANTVGLIIKDDMHADNDGLANANDWISLPQNFSTGQLNFEVNATSLQAGSTRNSTIIATAAGFKPASFEPSLLITVGCSPLSILPCDQLLREIPLNLTFNGNADGLPDDNGTATGFTVATPHSGSRLSEDKPASYPGVNGYEPSKININNENLRLTATKGIAALEENNQVNTLGVALQELSATFEIETKIIQVTMPASGDPQAGINFGFNENYYVKLVVLNGNSIQLKREINGVAANGPNNDATITVQNLDLTGKDVILRLLIDTNEQTIMATYAIDGNDFTSLSASGKDALDLPSSLIAGRQSPEEVKGASLAGVFASYNKASTTFDATFDYFKIGEPTLGITTAEETLEKIKVYPNPVQDYLNISLPKQNSIQGLSIYDMQGRMINTFPSETVQTNAGYRLSTGNLSIGVYLVQINQSNGNTAQVKFIKTK